MTKGFTKSFYRDIAAGKAVHQAFRAGLQAVWFSSPVEAFIPTLTLGVRSPLLLVNPARDEAQAIERENATRRARIGHALEAIRETWARLDTTGLAARLQQARSYVPDPTLAAGLESLFRNIKAELTRLEQAAQWPQARQCALAMRQTAELLSMGFREEADVAVKAIQDAISHELQRLRTSADTARKRNAWPDSLQLPSSTWC